MIGWYAHHHGRGHVHRVRSVAQHLAQPPTVLSSVPRPEWWQGVWEELPPDTDPGPHSADVVDPTAGGTLHWAPVGSAGLLRRGADVVHWVERHRPSLVVVDVSVEVTLLVRLLGVPVVVVAMQGDRHDRAHRTAYDAATALVAPWPVDAPLTGMERWSDKLVHTGAFSRFDGRPAHRSDGADGAGEDGPTVLLLWGYGGAAPDEERLEAAQKATPGWRWVVRAGGAQPSDVWDDLVAADVVVVHGGQNAVAEVAAARRPAVVVSQPRPHEEQLHRVRTLAEAGVCVGLEEWPRDDLWPALLERALDVGGDGWRWWSPGDGAQRAARAVEQAARDAGAGRDRAGHDRGAA